MKRHRSKRMLTVAVSPDEENHSIHNELDTDSSIKRVPIVNRSSTYQETPAIGSIDHRNINDNQIQQSSYVFRTIGDHNRNRLTILPAFPSTANDHDYHPLLANVPTKLLSKEELLRRSSGNHTLPYKIETHNVHYQSDLLEYYQRNYVNLISRLQIDAAILDCNYIRLRYCLNLFANERIRCLRASLYEVTLPENERPIAMEYFLQIDVDMFYMKSFPFCNVQRNLFNESLFRQNEPDLHFSIKPCGKCDLCCGPYFSSKRPKSCIHFGSSQKFIFRNGYETILNANALCDTRDIIYVLKCLCGEHEYIGETSMAFVHCLLRIRENNMLNIHQFLLGEKNFDDLNRKPKKTIETSFTDQLHLYQHSARCPKAIQRFLDYNPRYWRFVPMPIADAEQQDAIYVKSKTTTQDDDKLQMFINNLPSPPRGYQFSEQQYDQQVRFFQREHHKQLPDALLDLYNATIIAMLPEKISTVFRQFIQALFITHGETNLNVIGHLVLRHNNSTNISTSIHTTLPRGEWCRNLVRPRSLLRSTH